MKKTLCIASLCFIILSCNKPSNYGQPVIEKERLIWNPSGTIKNAMCWGDYERDYMLWSASYTALDSSQNEISKLDFLKRLTTGKYIPLKITTKDSSLCYQLDQLDKIDTDHKDWSNTIKNKAVTELRHFEMEGKPLPKFDFTDLNGKVFNAATTKGKIVVVKCWFIGCTTCVKEMPMLNKLVKKFENKDDIVFVSLAFDSENALRKFLTKTVFDYKVVSVSESYFSDDLQINGFPTHIIIDKNGLVLKVTNDGKEMAAYLDIDKNGATIVTNNSEKILMTKRILNMGAVPPPLPPLVN
jgi:thiol-disulfide isomerase/thioredoxin